MECGGLGEGQQIETLMAREVGLKVFVTVDRSEFFHHRNIERISKAVEQWYILGMYDMTMEIIPQGELN